MNNDLINSITKSTPQLQKFLKLHFLWHYFNNYKNINLSHQKEWKKTNFVKTINAHHIKETTITNNWENKSLHKFRHNQRWKHLCTSHQRNNNNKQLRKQKRLFQIGFIPFQFCEDFSQEWKKPRWKQYKHNQQPMLVSDQGL